MVLDLQQCKAFNILMIDDDHDCVLVLSIASDGVLKALYARPLQYVAYMVEVYDNVGWDFCYSARTWFGTVDGLGIHWTEETPLEFWGPTCAFSSIMRSA